MLCLTCAFPAVPDACLPALATHLGSLQGPVGAQLLNEGQRLALLDLQVDQVNAAEAGSAQV